MDVLVHPDVVEKCESSPETKLMVVEFSVNAVSTKYNYSHQKKCIRFLAASWSNSNPCFLARFIGRFLASSQGVAFARIAGVGSGTPKRRCWKQKSASAVAGLTIPP